MLRYGYTAEYDVSNPKNETIMIFRATWHNLRSWQTSNVAQPHKFYHCLVTPLPHFTIVLLRQWAFLAIGKLHIVVLSVKLKSHNLVIRSII